MSKESDLSAQAAAELPDDPFDVPPRDAAAAMVDAENRLVVNLDGYEGPLDLLLDMARTQKVDLSQISILALVEQYLVFINAARRLKLELAADYLVMAAWLAYLKSRLLLPREEGEAEASAEELAARLQMQLKRLEAMREAGARLMARDQVGRDVFLRGMPEPIDLVRHATYDCTLYELLKSYGDLRQRSQHRVYEPRRRPVLSLDEALTRLSRMLGMTLNWADILSFLPDSSDGEYRRSALASTFLASLELARTGRAELQQWEAFGPMYLRQGQAGGALDATKNEDDDDRSA